MKQLKIAKQITNRESQSLDRYLHEIGKINLITSEEEVMLARKIREGDSIALEKLTTANLRFVVSVAKQYQPNGLTLCDLINEGNVGLMKAAVRFDETRGFKFISYAVWWIRQAIMQAIAEQSRVVRLPLNRVGSIGKISRALGELEQELQREPSVEELADALSLTTTEVDSTIGFAKHQVSIHAPFVQGEETSLLDFLQDEIEESPDSDLIANSLQVEIRRALTLLTEREASVLILYFGLNGTRPMTLEEIGEKFNITRERIRQIKESATKRLRRSTKSKTLKTYL